MKLNEVIISETLKIRELKVEELNQAFPIVSQIRPHFLNPEEFIEAVKAMRLKNYQMVCLFENDQIVSYAGFAKLLNLYYGEHIMGV